MALRFISSIKNHKTEIILGIIILFGFILRFYGIDFGYHVDEPNIVERAINISNGDIHQAWYHWPAQSLMFLYAIVFKIFSWIAPELDVYLIARFISVIFGCVTIYLVFLTTNKITLSKNAGLIAAWFYAVSYLAIRNARYATPDTTMVMLLVLLLYLAICLAQEDNKNQLKRWYILSGLALGAAVATKYTAALGIIPLLLVHIFKYWKSWKNFLWFILAGFVAHTILNPFALFDLTTVYQQFVVEAEPSRLGQDWQGQNQFINNLWYYLSTLPEWIGTIVTWLGIAGAVSYIYTTFKYKKYYYLLPIAFFLISLISLSSLGLHWSRWALPFIPLTIILAGSFAYLIIKKLSIQKWLREMLFTIILIITIPQICINIFYSFSLLQPSTSDLVSEWLEENAPQDSYIISEVEDITLSKNFKYENLSGRLHNETYKTYKDQGVDYIVIKIKDFELRKDEPEKYTDELEFYNVLHNRAKKVFVARKNEKNILDHKTDFSFYKWLSKENNRLDIWDISQGEPLRVYQVK